MIVIVIMIIVLSIVSAILYRAGGMDKETKHWIPVWMRHSWVRDYLCPICALSPLLFIEQSWWFLLAYALSVASLSTYWDRLFKVDTFWFAGLMCGLAFFPLLFCGFGWQALIVRAAVMAASWGIICAISDNDFVEEYSRGAFFTLTVLGYLWL